MATTTATVSNGTPLLPATDNHFALQDSQGKTEITYSLQKAGPLTPGINLDGPVLDYKGPEGTLTFSGSQVGTLPTPLGTMITVTLNVVPDLRTLTFSMLLPNVVHGTPGSAQSFETMGILAQHHTSLLGPPAQGGNPTYSVLKLHGQASHVLFPD